MSTDRMNSFKQILSDNSYRVTEARINTFKLLVSTEPQSINQILTKAKGGVDRVSVYRNIELFEKLGIINRIYIGWKYKLELSDDFMTHHHHMSCLVCGKTIDIEDEQHVEDFIKNVSEREGFTPRTHVFEIDGYCRNCTM